MTRGRGGWKRGAWAGKKECFPHGVVALNAQPNLRRVAWFLRLTASGNPVLVTHSSPEEGKQTEGIL